MKRVLLKKKKVFIGDNLFNSFTNIMKIQIKQVVLNGTLQCLKSSKKRSFLKSNIHLDKSLIIFFRYFFGYLNFIKRLFFFLLKSSF